MASNPGDVERALQASDLTYAGPGGQREVGSQPQEAIEPHLTRLATIKQRVEEGTPVQLTDQDRVAMVAHRLLQTVESSQATGKIDPAKSAWEVSVRLALKGFREKYGRDPEPTQIVPRKPTSVEEELMRQKDAVETFLVHMPSGRDVEFSQPKDPRQRAWLRDLGPQAAKEVGKETFAMAYKNAQAFAPAVGVGARVVGEAAKRTLATAGTATVLFPGYLLGLVSEEELAKGFAAATGQEMPDGNR